MYVTSELSSVILDPLIFAIMANSGMSQHLLELRKLVEVGYCQLAAEKAAEEDFQRIQQAAQRFESLVEAGESLVLMTQADLSFHNELIATTGNPLVVKIGRSVESMFFSSIEKTISNIEGQRWGIEGHRQIIAAVRSKDAELIRCAVERSLVRWNAELVSLDLTGAGASTGANHAPEGR